MLPTGDVILKAIFDLAHHLRQRGHHIEVTDGEVIVTPSVHDDTQYVLESNQADVVALLNAELEAPTQMRGLSAAYTVH